MPPAGGFRVGLVVGAVLVVMRFGGTSDEHGANDQGEDGEREPHGYRLLRVSLMRQMEGGLMVQKPLPVFWVAVPAARSASWMDLMLALAESE